MGPAVMGMPSASRAAGIRSPAAPGRAVTRGASWGMPRAALRKSVRVTRAAAQAPVAPAAFLKGLSGTPLRPKLSATPGQLRATRRTAVKAQAGAAVAAEGTGNPLQRFTAFLRSPTAKKILPLGLMFFMILFNYTILRDTKDVLVVTARGSGAEIIPFLKTWVNLPMAIGFMVGYSKLSNVMEREQLFYTILFPFVIFFVSFAFVMYPLQNVLHPHAWADAMLSTFGDRFAGPVAIVRNWTFALFYVMAELWGSVVVSLLFWGFANQITNVDEAKAFYPLFGLGANVALIVSGQTVRIFSDIRSRLPPGVDGWEVSLKGMMTLVGLCGCIIAAIYWYINNKVMTDPAVYDQAAPGAAKKKKKKLEMSIPESMAFLASSRYIRNLAALVVCYGISINLVEVTWKGKIKAQYPDPNDYSAFMGTFSTFTGIVTFLMMLASRTIFKKFGWGVAAQITPVVLLVTGFMFFTLILAGEAVAPALAVWGITPLFAAVVIGAAQNIFSKSSKYSLFDPCKEMAYIPLDEESKVKGKAAVDVVGNPLGKSGGALIQQFLIVSFGSLSGSTPVLAVILGGIVVMWLLAARDLDKQFTPLVKDDLKEKIQVAEAEADPAAKSAGSMDMDDEPCEIVHVTTNKVILTTTLNPPKEGDEVVFKFVSTVNEETGLMEGSYVPIKGPGSKELPDIPVSFSKD